MLSLGDAGWLWGTGWLQMAGLLGICRRFWMVQDIRLANISRWFSVVPDSLQMYFGSFMQLQVASEWPLIGLEDTVQVFV